MYISRASSQSQRDCQQFDCGPVYYINYMKYYIHITIPLICLVLFEFYENCYY